MDVLQAEGLAAELANGFRQLMIVQYISLAGISICVYEYFMTFQDEVFYMWTKAPKPKLRVATPLRAISFYSRYGILFVITFSLSTIIPSGGLTNGR